MKKVIKIVLLLLLPLLAGCDTIDKLINGEDNNQPPTLIIKVEDSNPDISTTQVITAEIYDPEDQEMTVSWSATGGALSQTHGESIEWTAPADTATIEITAVVKDSEGAEVSKSVTMLVGNAPPVITSFTASSMHVVSGNPITLDCAASDPEGDAVTYAFQVLNGSGSLVHTNQTSTTAEWTSPANIGQGEIISLAVHVSDPLNFTTSDTVQILVYSNYGSLWVVDGEHRALSKYTSNGYKILSVKETLVSPTAVIGGLDDLGGCFVADQGADIVYKIDFNGNIVSSYEEIPHVIDIGLHSVSQKLLALSYSEGTITIVDQRTGNLEKVIYGLHQPTQIDVNQYSGDVWVVESGNNRVLRFNITDGVSSLADTLAAETALIMDSEFTGPTSLYIHHKADESLSHVYIADTYDNEIERLFTVNGEFERQSPISPLSASPQLLGALPVNLVDMLLIVNDAGKMELMEIGAPASKHALNGNYQFAKPQVLKVDTNTWECWIGDNGTNQLVKIKINSDYSFTVLRKLDGFLSIRDIAVNR